MNVGSRAYDLMYRYWAPWDAVGVRDELRELLETGRVDAQRHPRAVDLGCGTGANVVFLAESGFDATGIDFSPVAIRKARQRAAQAGVTDRCRFTVADLTADTIADVEAPFDLLIDFGTLDDLDPTGRHAMADTVTRLSHPGTVFLLWCFYADPSDLPFVSFHGPSRMAPGLAPGEEVALFGDRFTIEPGPEPRTDNPAASFVLTRRPDGDTGT